MGGAENELPHWPVFHTPSDDHPSSATVRPPEFLARQILHTSPGGSAPKDKQSAISSLPHKVCVGLWAGWKMWNFTSAAVILAADALFLRTYSITTGSTMSSRSSTVNSSGSGFHCSLSWAAKFLTIPTEISFLFLAYFRTSGPGSFQLAWRPMALSSTPASTAADNIVTLIECQVMVWISFSNFSLWPSWIHLVLMARFRALVNRNFIQAIDLV